MSGAGSCEKDELREVAGSCMLSATNECYLYSR